MTRLVNIGHDPRDTADAEIIVFASSFRDSGTRLTRKGKGLMQPNSLVSNDLFLKCTGRLSPALKE